MTHLLGLDFSDRTLNDATQFVLRWPEIASFDYIVTPNADHLVRLRRRPELRPAYEDAVLCLLDSRVIAKAARAFGLPAPPVVTGSDLVASVFARLPKDASVTIIGLRREFLQPLIARTGIRYPAHFDPPANFDSDPAAMNETLRFVLDHPARLVLLALGSPRQEQLAAAIKATGQATGLGLCVGAALDFLSGAARRAPVWMQQAGLEWLHRLRSDPRRLLRRYLIDDPPIFSMLLAERTQKLTFAMTPRKYKPLILSRAFRAGVIPRSRAVPLMPTRPPEQAHSHPPSRQLEPEDA